MFLSGKRTTQTRHLLDAEAFALMKNGTCPVKLSPGPLVHDSALVAAAENIRSCNAVLRTEHLSVELPDLGRELSLAPPCRHLKKRAYKENLSEKALAGLRELMTPEYRLFDKLGLKAATGN